MMLKNIIRLVIAIYLGGDFYTYAADKLELDELTITLPTTTVSSTSSLPSTSSTLSFEDIFNQTSEGISTPALKEIIPPTSIKDLTVVHKTQDSISLTWTTPGGSVTTYDIRYSLVPITDENWDDTIQVEKEPKPGSSGTLERWTIGNLSPQTTYYFAIKTSDEASNWSPLSKIANCTTFKLEDTDIPQTIKFIVGCEYAMSKTKFTDIFPLIGLKTHNRLNERLSLLTNFQLSSTIAASQSSSSELVQKSLEYSLGFLFELYRFSVFNKNSLNNERHSVSLGLLLRGGGVNVDDSITNIFVRTFYGIRFLNIGHKLNGAYLDIGMGRSENFSDKEEQRLKIEGFLPIYKTKFKNTIFVSCFCDSDGLGDKKDELKFIIGSLVDLI
ncbi:MAG: fibronectin type III domain-containing protein [bacterium]